MKAAHDLASISALGRDTGVRMRARSWRAPGALACGLCAGAVLAQPLPSAWPGHAESVLELLQAETRRALESVQSRRPAPVPAAAESIDSPARPVVQAIELAALYGTRERLTAIVYVDGVRKEYRPGAALPYAGAGSPHEYRLVRIVDTCVVLRKGARGPLRTACFRPESAVASSHEAAEVNPASHAAALRAPLPATMP